MRTTNLVERLNQEIRRRMHVARLFPNEVSCLRLAPLADGGRPGAYFIELVLVFS
ncbi:transposase mutator type [Nitrosococcus watsonii C-113]|uniref:Transposase mutator type n=1 Tax=Nitrosococcus watsoni (strain C-113) TaxID=105559 RepID=D8K9C9_NITWC|nr:transposase mutator type [Nitrosococcus watsonii C-113]